MLWDCLDWLKSWYADSQNKYHLILIPLPPPHFSSPHYPSSSTSVSIYSWELQFFCLFYFFKTLYALRLYADMCRVGELFLPYLAIFFLFFKFSFCVRTTLGNWPDSFPAIIIHGILIGKQNYSITSFLLTHNMPPSSEMIKSTVYYWQHQTTDTWHSLI